MYFLPTDKMHPNKFVEVELPTKSQIFSRTGQHAVNPGGSFSGDDPVKFRNTPTASAASFVKSAESYEAPENTESEK